MGARPPPGRASRSGEDSSSDDSSSSSSTSSSESSEDSDEESSEESDPSEESTSETPEESESETSEESQDEESAQSSEGTVSATKSGVSFELPTGWQTFDPSELLKDTSNVPKGVEDMAKAQGVTVDELLQNLSQSIDLMAMGETSQGFTDNVNVIPSPQAISASQLKTSYTQQGGTVTGTDSVSTSAGSAPAVTYTMSTSGKKIHGEAIAVPAGSGAAIITVSASDPETAEEAITTIADSVTKD
ncbi:MAG: hypothetical protein ACTMHL_01460 [Janibacter sp.]